MNKLSNISSSLYKRRIFDTKERIFAQKQAFLVLKLI